MSSSPMDNALGGRNWQEALRKSQPKREIDPRTALNCVAKFLCTDREDSNCKYYVEGEKYICKNSCGEYCESWLANSEAVRVSDGKRTFLK